MISNLVVQNNRNLCQKANVKVIKAILPPEALVENSLFAVPAAMVASILLLAVAPL